LRRASRNGRKHSYAQPRFTTINSKWPFYLKTATADQYVIFLLANGSSHRRYHSQCSFIIGRGTRIAQQGISFGEQRSRASALHHTL
jgi:hypothetical protein